MYDNIEGQKLHATIEQLKSDQTLVKISLDKSAFESLTVITGTRKEGAEEIFDIDPPKGFFDAIAEARAKRIHFEFTSKDQVTNHFDSPIRHIARDSVTLLFPEFIHRHQQRDNFRVKVLGDSHARLWIDDVELSMAIDNISLGGVFCLCPNKYKSKFMEEQLINEMVLEISVPAECIVINVQQAQVNRFEKSRRAKHFGIALEFRRIKRNDRKVLVQQIYELQRYYLQNRLKHFG